MNPRLIVIDGKTYHNTGEMPADVRARYEQALRTLKDQDGNRVPDVLEGKDLLKDTDGDGVPDLLENMSGTPLMMNSTKIIVDGQDYNRIEDLPPEARAKYEQAMKALDANRNGLPDFMEGMLGTQAVTGHAVDNQSNHTLHHAPRQPMPVSPVITPDTSNGWLLALMGVMLLFLCGASAVGVWYFLLR